MTTSRTRFPGNPDGFATPLLSYRPTDRRIRLSRAASWWPLGPIDLRQLRIRRVVTGDRLAVGVICLRRNRLDPLGGAIDQLAIDHRAIGMAGSDHLVRRVLPAQPDAIGAVGSALRLRRIERDLDRSIAVDAVPCARWA